MTDQVTLFGFEWGPMSVTRACSDKRAHVLLIHTKYRELQVSISPSGKSVRTLITKRKPMGKRKSE